MVERFSDWDKWKNTIRQAVDIGHKIGFEDETIIKIGNKIGDLLEWKADPENREQRVIKEMWDIANEDEQKTLTRLIVKMVSDKDVLVEK